MANQREEPLSNALRKKGGSRLNPPSSSQAKRSALASPPRTKRSALALPGRNARLWLLRQKTRSRAQSLLLRECHIEFGSEVYAARPQRRFADEPVDLGQRHVRRHDEDEAGVASSFSETIGNVEHAVPARERRDRRNVVAVVRHPSFFEGDEHEVHLVQHDHQGLRGRCLEVGVDVGQRVEGRVGLKPSTMDCAFSLAKERPRQNGRRAFCLRPEGRSGGRGHCFAS